MACADTNLLSPAGTLPASFANLSALYLVLNLNNNHLSGVQDTLLKLGNSVHVCSPARILAGVPLESRPQQTFLPDCQQCPRHVGKGRWFTLCNSQIRAAQSAVHCASRLQEACAEQGPCLPIGRA